jgi:16S rRNA (cytidine1402-2'-O)-methyltransferase
MHNNKSGNLYIVATPIGNLDDITVRALNIIQTVDYVAAEDTRHSSILLQHFNLKKQLISLHDFNEQQKSATLIKLLQQGKNIALISDAGTPLISDPGYRLVTLVQKANINIIPIPGPCAAITALCASGLPTDKFIFEGFLPAKETSRCHRFHELKTETRTLIFYETPHRVLASIINLLEIFGEQRQAVIARELTKKFETIFHGSLLEIKNWLESDSNQQKGEFVILVHGEESVKEQEINSEELKILQVLASELPPKQAASLASKIIGLSKNKLYALLLKNSF